MTFYFRRLLLAFLMVLMPLGLTFYMWDITKEQVEKTTFAKFNTMTSESEKALVHRMESYYQALLGGRGFFENSEFVSREEWKGYVETLDVLKNFPGINGIGWIANVPKVSLSEFIDEIRQDNAPDFYAHPKGEHPANFIITYIEPLDINLKALGLNIAFEGNRYEAATLSRDTGKAAITKRILLVQDSEKTPGFLFLLPMYKKGMPLSNIKERKAAFDGWIYAPFIGKNFMRDLTKGQGDSFRLQVYDEGAVSPETLIYDSEQDNINENPAFTVTKTIKIMQQTWTLVWSSTSKFEKIEASNEPFLVLAIGLFFSIILGTFMVIIFFKGNGQQNIKSEPSLLLPILIFCISAFVVFWLKQKISDQEQEFIVVTTQKEAQNLQQTIIQHMNSKISALKNMSQRWSIYSYNDKKLWDVETKSLIQNEVGLRAIEWADSSYHVRWIEPLKGNEEALNLNILFTPERAQMVKRAQEEGKSTITEPLELVQGYTGFLSYFPVYKDDVFDGFIIGIFDLNALLEEALPTGHEENFSLRITSKNNKVLYDNHPKETWREQSPWEVKKTFNVYGKEWELHLIPRSDVVSGYRTLLADFVLSAGLILAVMLAVITNFAQRSHQSSLTIKEKENLLSLFVKHTPAAVAMFDTNMCYMAASDRWYKDYNLRGREILGKSHYKIFPEIAKNHPHWLELHQRCLNGEVVRAEEEVFLRKDGQKDWLRYELRPWYTPNGKLGGLIMFTEVITERKQMDKMKDEFISTVNHELRTPLTSIQGALGLIQEFYVGGLENEGKKLLNLSYENCERLTLLVNDILDIEKFMAGKMSFSYEEVILKDLVEKVVSHNQGYAEKYKVTFNIKNTHKNAKVYVDTNRFHQALTNLLSNAAKFSPSGKKVDITVEKKNGSKVVISVKDRGAGIPASFQNKVFERFAQADSSSTRTSGGTGLGLNITKTIIEAFNGEVYFETEEGKGTTFYIVLPTV